MSKYQRYLFEYKFDGAVWGIEIVAANPAEARERLKAIGWAQYKGEVFAKIPCAPRRKHWAGVAIVLGIASIPFLTLAILSL